MTTTFEEYIDLLKNVLNDSYFKCKKLKIRIEKNEELLIHFICEDHLNTIVPERGLGPFLDGIKTMNDDINEDDLIELKKLFSLEIEKKQIENTKENYIYLLLIFDVQELIYINSEDEIPEETEEKTEKPLIIGIDDFGWNITIIDEDENTLFSHQSIY